MFYIKMGLDRSGAAINNIHSTMNQYIIHMKMNLDV